MHIPNKMVPSSAVVAVVDDNESVVESLCTWLSTLNMRSLGCADAHSLLAALVHGPQGWMMPAGRLHAAIIDLNLPLMNGFELAGRLLEGDPDLKVIIITAARWEEDSHKGQPPPGVRCLSKPFRLEDIEPLVLGTEDFGS